MVSGQETNKGMNDGTDRISRRTYLQAIGVGAGFAAGVGGLSASAQRASAVEPRGTDNDGAVIDDFEGGLIAYSGDMNNARTVATDKFDSALELSGNSTISSDNGLRNYPEAGD